MANRNHPGNRDHNLGFRLASTRQRPRARFTDRARIPKPHADGSSRAGTSQKDKNSLRRLVAPKGLEGHRKQFGP